MMTASFLAFAVLAGPFPAVAQDETGRVSSPTASDDAESSGEPETVEQELGADGNEAKQEERGCVNVAAAYERSLAAFLAGPEAYYDHFIDRGASLAIPTRNLLIMDTAILEAVAAIMTRHGLDSEQARQIAIGVGQAALLCASSQPQAALAFQTWIAGIGNEAIEAAFVAATGDVGTAAIGTTPGNTPSATAGSGPTTNPLPPTASGRGNWQPSGDATVLQTTPAYTFQGSAVFGDFRRSEIDIVSRTTP